MPVQSAPSDSANYYGTKKRHVRKRHALISSIYQKKPGVKMLKYGESCKGERHSPLRKQIENEADGTVKPKSHHYAFFNPQSAIAIQSLNGMSFLCVGLSPKETVGFRTSTQPTQN